MRRAILVQNDLFSSTAKTDINSQKNENGLEISYQVISSKVQKQLREISDWKIESVDGHYISISSYNPPTGSLYMKLLIKLRNF